MSFLYIRVAACARRKSV